MASRFSQQIESIDFATLSRRAAVVVTALLIVATAWASARLLWLLLTPASRPVPAIAVAAPSAPATATPEGTPGTSDAARVADSHLFGKAEVARAAVVEAPETRLNLKLKGVYATEDENEGYALIASGSGQEKLYATGQSVPGNATLKAVFPDRVILDRNGRYETLRMIDTKLTGSSGYVPRGAGSRSKTRKLGADSRLVKLRKQILRNPRKLTELVSAQPAYENGVFAGYRITTRRADPVFEELDLRSGDIITQVNGVQIDSPQKGLQILQQLARANQASIVIKRNGQYVELNLSL